MRVKQHMGFCCSSLIRLHVTINNQALSGYKTGEEALEGMFFDEQNNSADNECRPHIADQLTRSP